MHVRACCVGLQASSGAEAQQPQLRTQPHAWPGAGAGLHSSLAARPQLLHHHRVRPLPAACFIQPFAAITTAVTVSVESIPVRNCYVTLFPIRLHIIDFYVRHSSWLLLCHSALGQNLAIACCFEQA